MKITKRYRQRAKVYAYFAREWPQLDFSEEAILECMLWESVGKPVSPANGYAIGKGWMDVNIAMWKEDIANGLLFEFELEDLRPLLSGQLPAWATESAK